MAGAVVRISSSSFSEGAASVPSIASIAFLQAVRRALTRSESATSGDARSVPRRGNVIGRHPRALSQPSSRQRASSRISSAVALTLGIYAALIFSFAAIACMSESISPLQ